MNEWTWDRLRVFDAVAHTGSVGAAARLLQMSGSAVSQQLRRLQAEIGTSLVEPAGRGIRLTHDGLVLAEHTRELAEIVRRAQRDLPAASTNCAARFASARSGPPFVACCRGGCGNS